MSNNKEAPEAKEVRTWPWDEKVKVQAQCKWDARIHSMTIPVAPVICGGRCVIYWPKKITLSRDKKREASLRGLVNGLAIAAGDPLPDPPPSLPPNWKQLPPPAKVFAELERFVKELSKGKTVLVGTKQEYRQRLGHIISGYCPACQREQEEGERRYRCSQEREQFEPWLAEHKAELPSMYDGIYPRDPKTGEYIRKAKIITIAEAHGPLSHDPETGELENTGQVWVDGGRVSYNRPLNNAEVERFLDKLGSSPWADGDGPVREFEEKWGGESLNRIVEAFVLMSPADAERRFAIKRMTIWRLQKDLMEQRPELATALKTLGGDLAEYRRERVRELLKLIAAVKNLKD